MNDTETTRRIINFINNMRYDRLPPAIQNQGARAIIDATGCLLAGIHTPVGKGVGRVGVKFPQPGGSTLIGTSTNISPFIAAMANSFRANALDGDDGHRVSRLHAGGVIIPAAMAACEQKDCSGARFIEAVVLGYELGHRAGIVSQKDKAYLGSAYGATYGAAAAAAHILGLSPEETVSALGICEMHAPNCLLMGWITSRHIPMIKEGMGWSAATGLMAAYLAEEGVTGTLTLYEDAKEISRIDRLGQDYELERNYYKPFPSCRWSHSPLESLLELIRESSLTAEQVLRIKVRTFDKAARLDNPEPRTAEDAQYSIPFVLATALLEGDFAPKHHDERYLFDERILSLSRKVEVICDPELNRLYPDYIVSVLEVETFVGRKYLRENKMVLGDWLKPLSDQQIDDKFRKFTDGVITLEQANDILTRIKELPTNQSAKGFVSILHEYACKQS
ncbi:MAG TPA: MmgE/PrpD family protein [Thermodesulfobacteriota bacterium]|nr:MmgE/PrpD family protein [Thermodesulfobacteriota bacterium]